MADSRHVECRGFGLTSAEVDIDRFLLNFVETAAATENNNKFQFSAI